MQSKNNKEEHDMDYTKMIEEAKEKFGKLVEEQLKRVEMMKSQGDFLDYKSLDQIINKFLFI